MNDIVANPSSKDIEVIDYPDQVDVCSEKSYSDEIDESVKSNIEKVSSVSSEMAEILDQNKFIAFFSKGNNIRDLAENVSSIASVEKSTLDLVILLMGATVGHKNDYDAIMITLNELVDASDEDAMTLEHIINIKRAIQGLQTRDALFQEIVEKVNMLIDLSVENKKAMKSQKFFANFCFATGIVGAIAGVVALLITFTL